MTANLYRPCWLIVYEVGMTKDLKLYVVADTPEQAIAKVREARRSAEIHITSCTNVGQAMVTP